jgi:hypothetical protein
MGSFQRLRQINAVMALLHFSQGVLMVYLSTAREWTITSTYLDFESEGSELFPALEPLGSFQLASLVAAFLFISAIAHALIATVLYDSYVAYLKRGMNPYRWYEYAISASVMIVVIAMLAGIWDLGTLVALFGLVAVMNLMGLLMERHNQRTEQTDWTAFVVGCLAGVVPWITIAIALAGSYTFGDSAPPDFVIGIFVSIGILFNLFAINMVLQYKQVWRWEEYLFGEWIYIVLSLVAKSALAWQVFAGALNTPV